MKLLSGNSNRTLSQAIGAHLDMPLTKAQVKRFADNEVFAVIEENVRGEDGKPLEFSKAAAVKLFTDLPEVYERLQEEAKLSANFRDVALEEEVKN